MRMLRALIFLSVAAHGLNQVPRPRASKSLRVRGGGENRYRELRSAAKDLVRLYGPLAIAVDFVSLQCLGAIIFSLLTFKVISPPRFIQAKFEGKSMAKHGLNFAMTVAICESVFVVPRIMWSLYWTPIIAERLPGRIWRPLPSQNTTTT